MKDDRMAEVLHAKLDLIFRFQTSKMAQQRAARLCGFDIFISRRFSLQLDQSRLCCVAFFRF
jgi:hypothetical protein